MIPDKEVDGKGQKWFDVDVKDNPLRTCNCKQGKVSPRWLGEAKEIIQKISDNIQELGFKDTHYVYSGRGYHHRIQYAQLLKETAHYEQK